MLAIDVASQPLARASGVKAADHGYVGFVRSTPSITAERTCSSSPDRTSASTASPTTGMSGLEVADCRARFSPRPWPIATATFTSASARRRGARARSAGSWLCIDGNSHKVRWGVSHRAPGRIDARHRRRRPDLFRRQREA